MSGFGSAHQPIEWRDSSATDLSDPTLPAIMMGAEEARSSGRPLIVLTSLDLSGAALMGPEIPPIAYVLSEDQMEAMARSTRDRLCEAMRKAGAEGEPVVSNGRPADGILKAANDFGCSLIVLSTTGRSGLTKLLLGSTAEAVLEQAPCSVLVVRLHAD